MYDGGRIKNDTINGGRIKPLTNVSEQSENKNEVSVFFSEFLKKKLCFTYFEYIFFIFILNLKKSNLFVFNFHFRLFHKLFLFHLHRFFVELNSHKKERTWVKMQLIYMIVLHDNIARAY